MPYVASNISPDFLWRRNEKNYANMQSISNAMCTENTEDQRPIHFEYLWVPPNDKTGVSKQTTVAVFPKDASSQIVNQEKSRCSSVSQTTSLFAVYTVFLRVGFLRVAIKETKGVIAVCRCCCWTQKKISEAPRVTSNVNE
jgi:hypothetical protein